MRKLLRNLHLWIGLSAGTVLVLIGLTGSSLVFYKSLEEKIYSDVLQVEDYDLNQRITIPQALKIAEDKYPDGTVLGVFPPRHNNSTYLAYRWYETTPKKFAFGYLSIHPLTGEILGEKEWGKTVMTFIYKLHYTLTFGKTGALIVGFIGIFFIITMLIGLYLWWPKNGMWKQALLIKKNVGSHRRNFDLHRVFGFYPMIILLVVAFSGIYMIFPKQIKWGVKLFSNIERDVEHETKIIAKKSDVAIPYDQAIATAQKIFPDLEIKDFDRPHDANHPMVVSFADPNQPMKNYGYNQVFIHPYTGEVIHVRRWENASNGDAFLAWQFPLHNGEVFGMFGRLVIFLVGIVPLVLYVTGICLWRGRIRRKNNSLKLVGAVRHC